MSRQVYVARRYSIGNGEDSRGRSISVSGSRDGDAQQVRMDFSTASSYLLSSLHKGDVESLRDMLNEILEDWT